MLLLLMTIEEPEERTFWAGLYEQYQTLMLRAAYGILQNTQDAEDAVQEVFLRLIGASSRTVRSLGEEERKAYLIVCAKNQARKILRRQLSRAESPLPEEETALMGTDSETAQETAELMSEIRRLPRQQQEMLLLRDYVGLSFAEIGVITGMKAGAVQRMLSRIRTQIRRNLSGIDGG